MWEVLEKYVSTQTFKLVFDRESEVKSGLKLCTLVPKSALYRGETVIIACDSWQQQKFGMMRVVEINPTVP
jgi:hypothetical protein